MIRVLLFFSLLFLLSEPAVAIREGTATAAVFIQRHKQSGDFGKLALWHETAAECLIRISMPMNRIAHAYYVQHGHGQWAARAEKEAREIQQQYQYHRTQAETARQKSETPETVLTLERKRIVKFMRHWLPRYPKQFYEFGIYPTFFRKYKARASRDGDYAEVLRLEADAAEMCAAQYEKIPIAYGLKGYEKFRDVYLQHAFYLRKLATQNPNVFPSAVEDGRRVRASLETQKAPVQETMDAVLYLAESDARVKKKLAGQNGVHAYPAFQGFVWLVSFSNHSRGNLAIAIVDAKARKVVAVF